MSYWKIKLEVLAGGWWDWLGISQWVVSNSTAHDCFVNALTIIIFPSFSVLLNYLPHPPSFMLFPVLPHPTKGSEWTALCYLTACWVMPRCTLNWLMLLHSQCGERFLCSLVIQFWHYLCLSFFTATYLFLFLHFYFPPKLSNNRWQNLERKYQMMSPVQVLSAHSVARIQQ